MLALEVTINGKREVVAGGANLAVLTASLSLGLNRRDDGPDDKFLNVTGLAMASSEHFREHPWWIKLRQMKIGDEITLRIVESNAADPPAETARTDMDEYKRKEFEQCKRFYLDHRDEFEREEE